MAIPIDRLSFPFFCGYFDPFAAMIGWFFGWAVFFGAIIALVLACIDLVMFASRLAIGADEDAFYPFAASSALLIAANSFLELSNLSDACRMGDGMFIIHFGIVACATPIAFWASRDTNHADHAGEEHVT